jgi:hypothetical protein
MSRSWWILSVAVSAAAMNVATVTSAGARTATPRLVAVTLSGPTVLPNSNIVKLATAVNAAYAPKRLAIPPASTCDRTQGGATVTNTTKATQTITYHGKPFATLAPHAVELFCAYGGSAQYVLGLSKGRSTLTLNVA